MSLIRNALLALLNISTTRNSAAGVSRRIALAQISHQINEIKERQVSFNGTDALAKGLV